MVYVGVTSKRGGNLLARIVLSAVLLLILLPINAYALNYVARSQVSVEKSLYGAGEECM